MHDPIAYTYDADTHCPACARAAFGECYHGFIGCDDAHWGDGGIRNLDSEGNAVGVIAPWDEWCDPDSSGEQTLVCGTCEGIIEQHEHDLYTDPPEFQHDDEFTEYYASEADPLDGMDFIFSEGDFR